MATTPTNITTLGNPAPSVTVPAGGTTFVAASINTSNGISIATGALVGIFPAAGIGYTRFIVRNTGANPLTDFMVLSAASGGGIAQQYLGVGASVNDWTNGANSKLVDISGNPATLASGATCSFDLDLKGKSARLDMAAISTLGTTIQIDAIGSPTNVG